MSKGEGIYPDIGRQTPAGGAHIFLGQPNIFFVTVCTKDKSQCMANPVVHAALLKIWRDEATAWLTGYYVIMPDHVHLFCAPYDLHFGIDNWITFWKRRLSRMHADKNWVWQRRAFTIECVTKLNMTRS